MRALVDGLITVIEGEVISGELLHCQSGHLTLNPSSPFVAITERASPFMAGW